jgi:hypothetical protein
MYDKFQSEEQLILTLHTIYEKFVGAMIYPKSDVAVAVFTSNLLAELDDVEW